MTTKYLDRLLIRDLDRLRPCVEDYELRFDGDFQSSLTKVPPEFQEEGLVALIATDMVHAWELGTPKTLEDYTESYRLTPAMGWRLLMWEQTIRRDFTPPSELETTDFPPSDQSGQITSVVVGEQVPTKPLERKDRAQSASQIEESPPARLLGRYTWRCRLGRGGYGSVHQYFDEKLRKDVAIKFPTPEAPFDLFREEALKVSKLRHPHLARVETVEDTEDGSPFIVYEYVQGETLRSVLRELDSSVHADDAAVRHDLVRSLADIADALSYMHSRGLYHRDIKPENIMICKRTHQAILIDLGIAREHGESDPFQDSVNPPGTVPYWPPEIAGDEPCFAGPQSDIYSLGVVLYEVLAKVRPFGPMQLRNGDLRRGDVVRQIREEIVRDLPKPPSTFNPRLSNKLAFNAVTLKALNKNPQERFADAAEFAREIRKALHPWPWWKKAMVGVAAMVVVGATIIAGATDVYVWLHPDPVAVHNVNVALHWTHDKDGELGWTPIIKDWKGKDDAATLPLSPTRGDSLHVEATFDTDQANANLAYLYALLFRSGGGPAMSLYKADEPLPKLSVDTPGTLFDSVADTGEAWLVVAIASPTPLSDAHLTKITNIDPRFPNNLDSPNLSTHSTSSDTRGRELFEINAAFERELTEQLMEHQAKYQMKMFCVKPPPAP